MKSIIRKYIKVINTGTQVSNKNAIKAISKAYELVIFKRSKLKLGQLKFFYQPYYDKNNNFLYATFELRSSVQHAKKNLKKKEDEYDHIYEKLAKIIITFFWAYMIYAWLLKVGSMLFVNIALTQINRYMLGVIWVQLFPDTLLNSSLVEALETLL